MSSLGNLFRGFVVPALIALLLYLALHFAIIPLYRRHRARYSEYLPVHTQNPLSSLSSSTTGLRSRISSVLMVFLLPSRWAEWRYAHRRHERIQNAGDHNDDDDDGDEDEEMTGDLDFDLQQDLVADEQRERQRRDGLSLSIDARERGTTSDRRLSRELEQGFADSSDDEGTDVEDAVRSERRR